MARLRLLCAGAILAVPAGCYSWQLGASSGDGGRETSTSRTDGGGRPDGGQGAHDGGSLESDGSHATDTGHPIDSTLASRPDAGSCTSLFNAAMAALTRAQECTEVSTPCTTSVKDPCGCAAFLEQSNSEATQTYREALASLGAADCGAAGASCKPTCVTYTGTEGVCLSGLTLDGSVAIACSP